MGGLRRLRRRRRLRETRNGQIELHAGRREESERFHTLIRHSVRFLECSLSQWSCGTSINTSITPQVRAYALTCAGTAPEKLIV